MAAALIMLAALWASQFIGEAPATSELAASRQAARVTSARVSERARDNRNATSRGGLTLEVDNVERRSADYEDSLRATYGSVITLRVVVTRHQGQPDASANASPINFNLITDDGAVYRPSYRFLYHAYATVRKLAPYCDNEIVLPVEGARECMLAFQVTDNVTVGRLVYKNYDMGASTDFPLPSVEQ
jgi:hypothetical protein